MFCKLQDRLHHSLSPQCAAVPAYGLQGAPVRQQAAPLLVGWEEGCPQPVQLTSNPGRLPCILYQGTPHRLVHLVAPGIGVRQERRISIRKKTTTMSKPSISYGMSKVSIYLFVCQSI